METATTTAITVQCMVNAPVEKVWQAWTDPAHITQWYFASPDWHAPFAENDLRKGGAFRTTMAAKDGSYSFDFAGEYTNVELYKRIDFTMEDGRKVQVEFTQRDGSTRVAETFDPENNNPHELQRAGWQAILDNFKKYTETNMV